MINYNNKKFVSIQNTDAGELEAGAIFHYWQEGNTVWATYSGTAVSFGTLIAKVSRDGKLDMRYQHLNKDHEFRKGKCISTPEILEDGRIRLHEKWQWTDDDLATGSSVIEEVL